MQKIHERIKEKFGEAVLAIHDFRGDETAIVKKESVVETLRFLKEEPEFDFNILMDLSAVDYQTFGDPGPFRPYAQEGKGARFEVVYHLYSLRHNHRVRIKVPVEYKDLAVPTATGLWPAADWFEREVWDMFGIRFDGHPNLKRILMYEEFVGHPLRKDYPVNERQPLIGPKH
jgi:NADH-quinone oxidoreductase subunit C